MANLHFFYGPMNSGKSMALLSNRYNFLQKNQEVFVIKPKIDRIEDPKIISRIGLECPAAIMSHIKYTDIIKMREFYSKVYMIDEIQFFTPKDIDNLVILADRYDRLIFCYGLLVDVNEHLFPAAKRLIEAGAKLHEMPSQCEMIGCMNLANHHLRYTKNGMLIKNGSSIAVDDGKQIVYKSVCRQCYNKEMQKNR